MFINLALEYIHAINTGGVPTILNSLERVISSEIRRVQEETKMEYQRVISKEFPADKMPFDDVEMNQK